MLYQSVNIWYFGNGSQNTACPGIATASTPSHPPGLSMVPPSIYAIFPTIMASDGCNKIGQSYGPITTSFAPGEPSTIENGVTKVYNFNDLPCPPSGIRIPPGSVYAPLIAPPSFIVWDLDPAFSTCVIGLHQGVNPPFDPPIALPSVRDGLLGPGTPGDLSPRPDLGAHARPHVRPSTPAKTAEAKHKAQL